MPELAICCLVVAGVLLLPLIWFIATYNRFASLRQHLRESWADVDVELKRRHDLVPNLVSTVKGYAAHEKEIFEQVAALRTQAMGLASRGGGAAAQTENELGKCLHKLIAVAERYPDLKADRNFLSLQHELSNTEDRIAASRRFYNANVRELNTLRSTFPSNMVAGMFRVEGEGFFELDDPTERAAPTVS